MASEVRSKGAAEVRTHREGSVGWRSEAAGPQKKQQPEEICWQVYKKMKEFFQLFGPSDRSTRIGARCPWHEEALRTFPLVAQTTQNKFTRCALDVCEIIW
jgi:hypothetical protein